MTRAPAIRRYRGFNLMEVLVALGIFAIGFVAVASLFPAGALLQRNAADDAIARQIRSSARAILQARSMLAENSAGTDGLEPSVPTGMSTTPYRMYSLENLTQSNSIIHLSRWTLGDRSYPTTIADPTNRDWYWVPLVRRLNNPAPTGNDWEVILFVLRREASGSYPRTAAPLGEWGNYNDGDLPGTLNDAKVPGVIRVKLLPLPSLGSRRFNFSNDLIDPGDNKPDQLRPGDLFLDDFGTIHRVLSADVNGVVSNTFVAGHPQVPLAIPSIIWYGKPADSGTSGASPTAAILVVPDVVE